VLGVPGARRHLREAGDVVVDGGAGTVALDAPC